MMWKHSGGEPDEMGWVRVRRGEAMTLPCQGVTIRALCPSGNDFLGKRQGDLIVSLDQRWRPLHVKQLVAWKEVNR